MWDMSPFGIAIFDHLNTSKLNSEVIDCTNSSLEEIISALARALKLDEGNEHQFSFQRLDEEVYDYSPKERPPELAILNFDSLYRSNPMHALAIITIIYRAGVACEKNGFFWSVRLEIGKMEAG